MTQLLAAAKEKKRTLDLDSITVHKNSLTKI
jgi:hypothetical protein